MKKIYILFGVIIFFLAMPMISPVRAFTACVHLYDPTYSEDINSVFYNVEFQEGDKIYWKFKTFSDEFIVYFAIEGEVISNTKTADSGVYDVTTNGTYTLLFKNYDLEQFRHGWIELEFDTKPVAEEAESAIPGYQMLVIIGIIIGFSFYFIRRKKNL